MLLKFLMKTIQTAGFSANRPANSTELSPIIDHLRPCATGHELIRIGGDGDGGYLVPDVMDGIEACFSPGVSTIADFEEMVAERYGMRSYLADYSVEKPPLDNPLFDFEKKFLGSISNDVYIRLEDWMDQKVGKDFAGDLLLQMDIEGSEFDVLMDTPEEYLQKFRVMVIEFHAVDLMFDLEVAQIYSSLFHKLSRNFTVAHLHPNNCCGVAQFGDISIPRVLEATFLRNDYVQERRGSMIFPHPLDQKNLDFKEDITLPECWR